MAIRLPTSRQPSINEPHEFGPGVIRELATRLYRSQMAIYREAVSNAIDAMVPYLHTENKVEIYTNVLPDNDIIIEDWGTGIEDYEIFKVISPGRKVVRNEVSSYQKVNEKIIGQKGMGKLSFLNLSGEERVEFLSNNESVGMYIVMTMDGFSVKHINSDIALPHHGLKVIIKRAKKPVVQDSRLIEYLSRRFAIRIARGLKIFVNGIAVHKPDGFD